MCVMIFVKIPSSRLNGLGINSFHQDIIVSFITDKPCSDKEKHEIINIFLACVSARQNMLYISRQKCSVGSTYSTKARKASYTEAKTYHLFLEMAREYGVQPASCTIPCN